MSEKKNPDYVRGKLCYLIMKFDLNSEQDRDAFIEISSLLHQIGYIVIINPLQLQPTSLSRKLLETLIKEMMLCCSMVALIEKNEKNDENFVVNDLMMTELTIAKRIGIKTVNIIKDKKNDMYNIGKGV